MSFKGYVKMYNETYYVDTETNEGVDKVLKKIEPLLCKMASRTYISGYSFDDIKQELTIIAINGIRHYDSTKETALSTFLHGHLKNKLISKLKSQNKIANNANLLNTIDEADLNSKIKKAKEELPFSQCNIKKHDGGDSESILFENSLEESDAFYYCSPKSYDDTNFKISLRRITKNLDQKTSKIVELMCFEDYTLKDAAEEVGLTSSIASIKIKSLAKKHSIKSILGKVEC